MRQLRPRLDLNGTWAFELDRERKGNRNGWSKPDHTFSSKIGVPGCWQYHGFGQRNGQIGHDYQGTAWYQRKVKIPEQWNSKSIFLCIGGALRRTVAFVNGVTVGSTDTLLTPFEFDCTQVCRPGAENVITLCIDNSYRSGKPYSGYVASHAEEGDVSELVCSFNGTGNWGGIYDSVMLEARPRTRVAGLHIVPQVDSESVTVIIDLIQGNGPSVIDAVIGVEIISEEKEVVAGSSVSVAVEEGKKGQSKVEIPLTGADLWWPERTYLYTARITLKVNHETVDHLNERFGMRKMHTERGRLYLNNRPYLLRGYSIGRGDPILGTLPWLKETLLEQFKKARKMGFNHVRYHSGAPVRAAFEAADEVGILIQAELPVVFSPYLLPNREFLRQELVRLLVTHRNHPSLFSLSMGNEFNLKRDFKTEAQKRHFSATIQELYDLGKSAAPGILIMSNTGYIVFPTDLASSCRGFTREVPTLRHESGGYKASLPDTSLVEKFKGVLLADKLKAKRDWLEKHSLTGIYPVLRKHSEWLQQASRKWHLEKTRMIPELAGYQYWKIDDSPPDSVADGWDDGILNYFWQRKDVKDEEVSQVNSETVILLRNGISDRSFWADRGKEIPLWISHYGHSELQDEKLMWSLESEEGTLADGEEPLQHIPVGSVEQIGIITIPPIKVAKSTEVTLGVALANGKNTNCWNFWAFREDLLQTSSKRAVSNIQSAALRMCFPFVECAVIPHKDRPVDLIICDRLDSQVFDYLRSGGKVLLLSSTEGIVTGYFGGGGQGRGTHVEDHSALGTFPHRNYCGLQFYNLMETSRALPLPDVEGWEDWAGAKPLIWGLQVTPGYAPPENTLQRIAWLVEGRVARGSLVICTLRIMEHLDDARPEAVMFLNSLMRYALSDDFCPANAISEEEVSGLLCPYDL